MKCNNNGNNTFFFEQFYGVSINTANKVDNSFLIKFNKHIG